MNCFHTATFQTKAAFLFSRSEVRGSLAADRPVPFPLPFVRREGDQGGGSPGAEPGRLVPPPSECLPASEGPCRGRVPPNLFGRSLAGGLGGSPSRRAPGALPSPRISIAAHSLDGNANQEGWGARGEGRPESGHMLLVSTGRDGRGHGRERTTITTRPGEWHQVARRSGWSPRSLGFVLCFRSRRSAGRPAGSAGGFAGGPAGVACRGPAQMCGASRRSPCSPGASDKE